MRKLILVICLIFSFNLSLTANTIDSLLNLLNNQYVDKPKLALKTISQIYNLTYQIRPQLAMEMAGRAIILSDSIFHDPEMAAQWKMKLAKVYLNTGKLDLATRYFSELRDFYRIKKDQINFAISLMYLGDIYYKLKVLEIAQEDYKNAEKIFKKYQKWDLLAKVRSRMAQVLYDNYQTKQAYQLIYNTLDSFNISNEAKADLYSVLAKLYLNDEVLDSAFIFYTKAQNIYQAEKNKFKVANTLLNIGYVLLEKQQYDKAIEYFNKALELFNKLNSNSQIAEALNYIALTYFKKDDLEKAREYFLQAIKKAQIAANSNILQNCYFYLGKIYEQQKKLDQALNYYKLYIDERNKYFEQITSQGYAEIILMFQNEEKQREIQMLKKEESIRLFQLRVLMAVVLLLLIFVGIITLMLNKLRKAKKLLEQQYKQIKLQKREMETQSRILEKATNDLLRQKEKIEKQNRDISASIKYASRIQKAMLPKPELFEQLFDEYFIFYKPKETVSGDFYWLTEVFSEKPSLFQEESNKKIILAVADCTGHGVPGAFMAMLGDAYLNQIIKVQRIYKPDRILEELNKNIRQTLHQGGETESTDGMDIGICVIDKNERTLDFAGAKLDLLYIQNEQMVRVHGDLYSIGGLKQEKDKKFTSKRIDITTRTIFYMYSDGFQDQFGGKYGRKYMAKNFREFLFKIHKLPLQQQKIELEKEFKRWKGKKYPQMDDITVIGIKIYGKYETLDDND